MENEKLLVIGFIIAWFVYWGWMFATRPDTAFKVNEMGQKNMSTAARGVGKAVLFGIKRFRR